MKLLKHFIVFSAVLLTFITTAKAQTAISDEKRKLIAEIITTTKADKKIEEVMRAIFKQMDENYPVMIKGMVEKRNDLTPAQKTSLEQSLIKHHNGETKFQDRLVEAINFQEYVEQTFYPLYDKFFSADDLKNLLDFYKTPTGQKMTEVLPQLTSESIRLAQEILLPKLIQVNNQIINEDINKAQKQPPKRVNK
ncbi:MAG: DUF2059 domain-containing protein [Pyrinomonadaceae bacterium]